MKIRSVLLIAAVCAAVPCCKEVQNSHRARQYSVMTLQPASRQLSSVYSATIRGKQDIDIRPKVSGYITEINVKEGSRVSKGQTLFVIDQTTYESELQTAIANVNVAKAAVAASELSLNSKEQLFNQKIISEYDLQMARTTLARDKAQLVQAAFYPSVRITPSLGWDKALTSPAGWLVSVGSGLTQPLFARGALKSSLTIAEARQEEAAIAFRQILLKAGAEVSDALALCSSARSKTDVRIRQINALESAVVSTRELMRHSESTYLEVLTAQQSLLSARLLQVSDRYDLLKGTVSLYRALGGGAE